MTFLFEEYLTAYWQREYTLVLLAAYVTRSFFQQWSKRSFVSYNELLKCYVEFIIFQQWSSPAQRVSTSHFIFQKAPATYGCLLARSSLSQSDNTLQIVVGKVEQASTSSCSRAIKRFRFSTMNCCTVELVAVAKLHGILCEKREVIFCTIRCGQTYRVYRFFFMRYLSS